MQTLLTIAGFDPSSGAGITADLMVFAAHNFFGTSCITGLTVQSTTGVRACYPVDAGVLEETLACLDDDLPPAGIKIGMLGSKKAVEAVATYLERLRGRGSEIPVVVDPVLRASSGRELLEPGGAHMLRHRLFPLADWVTPNREELGWLTALPGLSSRPDQARDELESCSEKLQLEVGRQRGRQIHVLAKGGDMNPPDDLLLTKNGERHWIEGRRVETTSTHGTGCALSSALLCRLAMGDMPLAAASNAKKYVTQALARATHLGHGHGPMNHLWPLRQELVESPSPRESKDLGVPQKLCSLCGFSR